MHGDYKDTQLQLDTFGFRDRYCRISPDFFFFASSHLGRKESAVVAFHQTLRGFMFFHLIVLHSRVTTCGTRTVEKYVPFGFTVFDKMAL